MVRWPPPTYSITLDWDVPVSFAFGWCTDYQADDSRRSREHFDRRVVKRTPRGAVIEDLWDSEGGWGWRHTSVTLRPPNRWHAESFGSVRSASIDYSVDPRPGGGTRFRLVMRRRPSPIRPHQPKKAELEAELRTMWTNYGEAMTRDYRRRCDPPVERPLVRSARMRGSSDRVRGSGSVTH